MTERLFMNKLLLQRALDAMLKGKKFRIKKEFRSELGNRLTSQWFEITAIHVSGEMDVQGDSGHQQIKGINPNNLIGL